MLFRSDAARWCEGLERFEALAMSRPLADWAAEADVPVAELSALAELYGANAPAAILVGWGMQRRSNGSAIVRCLDALGLITGNVGVSGGGVSFYFRRRGAFDTRFVHVAPPPRELCEPTFGEEIMAARDPAVRAVWITAGNPVAMLPDSHATARALSSRDFVAVVDSTLTDTARLATVVLPCATMLEDDDVVGAYGHHHLSVVRPAVRTAGAWTDYEIVQALAARTGLAEHFAGDARSWQRRMLHALPLEALERGSARNPLAPTVAFAGRVFPTPSGKARILTELPPAAARPTADFPLLLHALSTPASQSSQWSPAEPEARAEARVHPEAAAGLPDRATARLRSALGAMEEIGRAHV